MENFTEKLNEIFGLNIRREQTPSDSCMGFLDRKTSTWIYKWNFEKVDLFNKEFKEKYINII